MFSSRMRLKIGRICVLSLCVGSGGKHKPLFASRRTGGELRVRASFAARHECADFLQAADTAARPQGGAVEGGHGVAEIEGAAHRHAFENSIAKRPVKHVSRPRGI